MDTKLVDEVTRHNGKRECLIKGLDEPPTTDVRKMACIRQIRQECKLPDKYTHIPCLPDLPEQADPVGIQAMMAGLNPENSDLILTGPSLPFLLVCSCSSLQCLPCLLLNDTLILLLGHMSILHLHLAG
jgi:hypothetical protein